MKRLVLLLLLMVIVTIFSEARKSGSKTAQASRALPSTAAADMQEPAPQEWDPLKEGVGDVTEGPLAEAAPAKPKPIEIVKRRFTPEGFAKYVKTAVVPELMKSGHWRPSFIVLHHTGVPSINQRPSGFTTDNMQALAHYYGVNQKWRTGPHVFVDQNGIWVFTRLTRRGTHSPSWNRVAWGIEQLGNFITESYVEGDGAKVRDNAIAAVAILCVARGFNAKGLRFHKDDPKTTHKDCPGDTCVNSDVLTKIEDGINDWRKKWNSL